MPRTELSAAMLVAHAAAKINWNLESSILKSLENLDAKHINHALFLQEEYDDYD